MKNDNIAIYTAKDKCTSVFMSYGSILGSHLIYPCFRITPEIEMYMPQNVINGYNRPFGKPNLWISEDMEIDPAWIKLEFDNIKIINEIIIYLNNDLNRDYNNLNTDYMGNGWNTIPQELIKDYSIYIIDEFNNKEKIAHKIDNYQRYVRHMINKVRAKAVIIEPEKTYGSKYAEIFEIRMY